jgi:hypothetical protein
MSGNEWYPPPGHGASPGAPPPGPVPAAPGPYPPGGGGPQGWAPPPGMLGAAHKPGAMPLRPLGLGDMYDAAFRIIRFNPKATVGSAVLVAAGAMALPLIVAAAFTWTVDLSLDPATAGELDNAELAGLIGTFAALGIGAILQWVGTILVTGMIAHVTAAAAVGLRLGLGEAWRATHGKRWRLIGTSVVIGLASAALGAAYVALWVAVAFAADGVGLVVLWGVLSGPAFLALLVWLWIRVAYLPVPVLMLEPVGAFGAFGRGYRLSRHQFWRIFGIALLTVVITLVASWVLSIPISQLGQLLFLSLGPQYAVFGIVVVQAITSVLTAAFVSPFTGAVTSLQYLDQRIRKEAYDVELMTQAGITAS